jgi:saccharopine dehydrogenase-like NADP-dependent oxidoreductase
MEKMRWLGLFSEDKIGVDGETATDAMSALLQRKLALQPGGRDLVILAHELEVTYPQENSRRERLTSTLLEYGQPDGFTAMSRTVGLPAALAVKLLLTDKLPMTGAHIPTHPDIYTPILEELEESGIVFKEKATPIVT